MNFTPLPLHSSRRFRPIRATLLPSRVGRRSASNNSRASRGFNALAEELTAKIEQQVAPLVVPPEFAALPAQLLLIGERRDAVSREKDMRDELNSLRRRGEHVKRQSEMPSQIL